MSVSATRHPHQHCERLQCSLSAIVFMSVLVLAEVEGMSLFWMAPTTYFCHRPTLKIAWSCDWVQYALEEGRIRVLFVWA